MGDTAPQPSSSGEVENALLEKVVAALPDLSRKHRDIADFILQNQDTVAFASAAEVGARTGTSAATVVRFCQTLGYEGYPELQAAIRARQAARHAAVKRLEERMETPLTPDDPSMVAFAHDLYNIERTAALTDTERLQVVASAMLKARQVLIVGSGMAGVLVECTAYCLQLMDIPARAVTGGEEPLAMALAFLQADDLVLGISFRRNPRYTLKAVEEARAAGAVSVAIADSELSPLFQAADHGFLVFTEAEAHIPSPAAAVVLLNALLAVLSRSAPEQAAQSWSQIDSTYHRSGLLDE